MANEEHLIEELETADLHFDRENPRLAEYGISGSTSEKKILSILWDAMDIRELIQSIQASGYFPHEPLIVDDDNGRQIVIEGNRRLAAVKLLLKPSLAEPGWKIPKLKREQLENLKTLPAILSDRENSWRYLGFKHVNGPAKWSSYAKAKYIADIHQQYNIPLEEIAAQIGDRHKTVQRLYRGLMVIQQAEDEGVYDRSYRIRDHFSFSHLYTGLDYDGISKFLSIRSIDAEATRPVPKRAIENLGELCIWLYGDKRDDTQPIVRTQNPHLKNLNEALKSLEGVAALRRGEGLEAALEKSRPPAAVLEEALTGAKSELQRARGYLTTGFNKSRALLEIAEAVVEIAEDVYNEMYRKMNTTRRSRAKKG